MDTGVRVLGRFVRWGLVHGPAWGALSVVLLHGLSETGVGPVLHLALVPSLAVGVGAGLVVGPVLGVFVGAACLGAERLPRWLLDAPDYVAVAMVVVVAVLLARWTVLPGLTGDVTVTVLAVCLLALPAAVDAARSAPPLLHPAEAEPVHRVPLRLRLR